MEECLYCNEQTHWIEMVRTPIGSVCNECAPLIVQQWIEYMRFEEVKWLEPIKGFK